MNVTYKPEINIYVYTSVFSSLCIIVGLIWDVSWHYSIGRDGLFAPPHDVIYLGAVVGGLFSAFQVISVTVKGSEIKKKSSVKFWGVFYSPLGAMFCVWGAIAMLTSAPFDDWWHNTYGLDIVILSPPHSLLMLGMMMIQFGAIIAVLSSIHAAKNNAGLMHKCLFVLASGLLLTTFYILFSAYLQKDRSHSISYYILAAILFPLFLIAIVRGSKIRWAATLTAAVYMFILMVMLLVLPIFHATPRLGPVLNHFDHYQPFHFPLLLVIPAICIDLVFYKIQHQKMFIRVILASVLFLLVFIVIQWNFGTFLQTSPHARNWFFGSYSWYFGARPNSPYRYAFNPFSVSRGYGLVRGIGVATVLAVLSGLIGSSWGRWMERVQR